MDCQTAERENIPERYLAGELDPQSKEAWELHYFGCDHCAEQLATWQAVEKPLRAMAKPIRQEISPRKISRTWLWGGAAIAAALVVGWGVKLTRPSDEAPTAPLSKAKPVTKSPAAQWTEIARLEPPAYQPAALRSVGSNAEAQFIKAMEPYLRGDYQQTISGLQAVLQLDPAAAAPRFFLGASEVLIGNPADGARELDRVASGDSPFAQEARFDLAKAYLQQGNKDQALATLRPLTEVPGEFREAANRLMASIAATQ